MNNLKEMIFILACIYLQMPVLLASEVIQPDCPANFSEWKDWRFKAVRDALRVGYSSGINSIQMKIQTCDASFKRLGNKKKCFENIDRFSQQYFKTHSTNHSLALNMQDSEYLSLLESQNIGSLPSIYRREDFLRKLDAASEDDFPLIAHDMEQIGPKGTIAFYYRSKHLPSVDDAAVKGRIFLYIPGWKVDVFSQFAVGRGKSNQLPNSISVITVLKSDTSGRRLVRPKVYFNDLWRIRGRKVIVLNRLFATGRMENCYSCHKSPLITVYPDTDVFDLANDSDRITSINEIMSKFAGAEHVGVETEAYGPSMGIDELNPESCQGIAPIVNELDDAGRCGDCHNGEVRGKLNFPSGLPIQLPIGSSLAHGFVVNYGLMPPILNDLSYAQRERIFNCLVNDYYGDFTDPKSGRFNKWLLQEECG